MRSRTWMRATAHVGIAIGISSSSLSTAVEAAETDTCTAVTRDLRSQIEVIKQLKAQPANSLAAPSKHPQETPQQIATRDREEADVLNRMLPGMGCAPLDIDRELKQPTNQALLPKSAPARHKKHKIF